MTRHLILMANGSTIAAVLDGLTDEDALLNVALHDASGSAVAINPATDNGALIDNGLVEYSAVDGLVLIADGSPAGGFGDFEMEEVEP